MPTSKDAPKEETAVFESKIETKQNCIVTNIMQLYLVHGLQMPAEEIAFTAGPQNPLPLQSYIHQVL